MSSIIINLIFIALLGKVGVKMSFEFDKIVITKNDVFVGKRYYNQCLFVLNISKGINESTFEFSAYMIPIFCDILA